MRTHIKTSKRGNLVKGFLYLAIAAAFFYTGSSFAANGGFTEIADRLGTAFQGLARLMIAVSYLAGIGFVISSIFKFKQHKDNPTQIPLGTPLAMLVIGVVLIFLPAIIGPIGTSIFGENAKVGGFKGELQGIPGADK